MIASYKFIQKLWGLHEKIKNVISEDIKGEKEQITKYTNQFINKINNNLERFNYNVIIANMYEAYNFLFKKIDNNTDSLNLKENYRKILATISPVVPHLASECLSELNFDSKQEWPEINTKYLQEDNINYVIQINGKKRAILNTNKDITEEKLLSEIKKRSDINKIITNKKIKKSFFVKNKLINILLYE